MHERRSAAAPRERRSEHPERSGTSVDDASQAASANRSASAEQRSKSSSAEQSQTRFSAALERENSARSSAQNSATPRSDSIESRGAGDPTPLDGRAAGLELTAAADGPIDAQRVQSELAAALQGEARATQPGSALLARAALVPSLTMLTSSATSAGPVAALTPQALVADATIGAPTDVTGAHDAPADAAAKVHDHGQQTPAAPSAQRDAPAPETSTVAPTRAASHQEALDRAADVLRQFRVHLAPDLRQATIQLWPAELGRISIRLALEEGGLRAALRAEKRETLEILGRHLPELRASLAQQGIDARHFDLALGFEHDGRNASAHEEPFASASGRSSSTPAVDEREQRVLTHMIAAESGVDTYA